MHPRSFTSDAVRCFSSDVERCTVHDGGMTSTHRRALLSRARDSRKITHRASRDRARSVEERERRTKSAFQLNAKTQNGIWPLRKANDPEQARAVRHAIESRTTHQSGAIVPTRDWWSHSSGTLQLGLAASATRIRSCVELSHRCNERTLGVVAELQPAPVEAQPSADGIVAEHQRPSLGFASCRERGR